MLISALPILNRADAEGRLVVYAVAPDVVRIDYAPAGAAARPSPILERSGLRASAPQGFLKGGAIVDGALRARLGGAALEVSRGGESVSLDLDALRRGTVRLVHPVSEPVYGLRGIAINARGSTTDSLRRDAGATVAASYQGDGGAPFAFSDRWGLFVDSVDARAVGGDGTLALDRLSQPTIEAYVVLGPPKRSIEVATQLTGPPPMPPKWTLGFMNSQWGSDQREIETLAREYRAKKIPIDAFILDFDYKAWGEDDYGELRWNSTDGPGNVAPRKFPDGQSGAFAAGLGRLGFHLVGIMKPRFIVRRPDGGPTKAGAEIAEHGWALPGEKPYPEYFSHRLASDVDFSKPDVRAWFWAHSRNLFDSGIAGWWNDEADSGFPSLGFGDMERALYDGQRSVSDRRVWSLNRNFYLGDQRYAYATWSGDIGTGLGVMAAQRPRMLATLDLGQPHWSMDSGGFGGHPYPETYARWIEFAAVTPIMRVHGTYGEKRQPWVYGPVAEAAAKRAIEFRYRLLPSLYSWEHEANRTGVGIVRPLFWEFPDDAALADDVDAWMLGDGLLASPVVASGARAVTVLLPPGRWFDYWTDAAYVGGGTITRPSDPTSWSDMPLFVRAGTILASRRLEQHVGERPASTLILDVWPDATRTGKFEVYDDDGATYAYEKGASFSQTVLARPTAEGLELVFSPPKGSYATRYRSYWVRIHEMGPVRAVSGRTHVPVTKELHTSDFLVPAGKARRIRVVRG